VFGTDAQAESHAAFLPVVAPRLARITVVGRRAAAAHDFVRRRNVMR
jgi:ornithine cyclodeaminase/alanine dehydrogenase-like protein (mu-crystallin family)